MFPVEQAWMINPQRSTKGRKKMARRRARRKVSHKRSRKSRKAVMVFKANPRRRRRHAASRKASRRRYRSNPGGGNMIPTTGFIMDAAYVTGGFIGAKLATGFVLPMVGVSAPIARIGVKAGVAIALGWAGRMFLGKSAGNLLMLGGFVEVVNDAVQTYVAPFVPAIATQPVGAYPELSVYPALSAYPNGEYINGMVDERYDEAV